MYRIAVPVEIGNVARCGMEKTLAQAEKFGAKRGINTSVKNISSAIVAPFENFCDNDNRIKFYYGEVTTYDLTLNEKAEVLSDTEHCDRTVTLSYQYENADGNRFLVLYMNTRDLPNFVFKNYERGRQYDEQIEWLGGKELPACVYGNPSSYLQCKKDRDTLAVGLWNLYPDIVFEPTVKLGELYAKIEFINCSGMLNGDHVVLSDIPAFGFAGFEVRK